MTLVLGSGRGSDRGGLGSIPSACVDAAAHGGPEEVKASPTRAGTAGDLVQVVRNREAPTRVLLLPWGCIGTRSAVPLTALEAQVVKSECRGSSLPLPCSSSWRTLSKHSVPPSFGPLSCEVGGYEHLSCGRGVRSTDRTYWLIKGKMCSSVLAKVLNVCHKVNALFPSACHLFLSCSLIPSQHPLILHFFMARFLLSHTYIPDHAHVGYFLLSTPLIKTTNKQTSNSFLTGVSPHPYFFLYIFLFLLYLHHRWSGCVHCIVAKMI